MGRVGSSWPSGAVNQAAENSSTETSAEFDGFGSLVTVISLSGEIPVSRETVMSNHHKRPIPMEQAEGFRIGDHILLISHYEWGSPTDSFTICGCEGWGQTVVFRPGEKISGTVLEY